MRTVHLRFTDREKAQIHTSIDDLKDVMKQVVEGLNGPCDPSWLLHKLKQVKDLDIGTLEDIIIESWNREDD